MSELTSLHGAMDRLFGEVFGETFRPLIEEPGRMPTYRLPVDVVETDKGYQIKALVPGFRPENVDVTFSDGVLTINARSEEEKTRQAGNYLMREVAYGNLRRQITLPGDVRAEDIKATFDSGVLSVEVPRTAKPEPKRIAIQHAEQAAPARQRQPAGAGSRSRRS